MKKRQTKYIIIHVLLSLFIIILMPSLAVVLKVDWAAYVFTPFLIIFVWVMALINHRTDLQDKSWNQAKKMCEEAKVMAKSKVTIPKLEDLKPNGMIEIESDMREKLAKIDVEVPLPHVPVYQDLPVYKDLRPTEKIMLLKKRDREIDAQLMKLREEKQDIREKILVLVEEL